MCLGVPGKVLAVSRLEATADFFGVTKVLPLDTGFGERLVPEIEGEPLPRIC
jgi:hydrogenase maturation factor